MRSFAAAALIGAASAITQLEFDFMNYISAHGKSYANLAEYNSRFEMFAKKDAFIKAHDPVATKYTVAHNKFSDWTDEEYKAILTYRSPGGWEQPEEPETEVPPLGANVNWVTNGCVNKIQDQGQCGSCWAFSGTASTEGAWCIAHSQLLKLSEQQSVDCVTSCYGCNGGWAYKVFVYFESHYAMSESSYPYTAKDGTCKYSSTNHTSVKTTGYKNVTANSISAMTTALGGHVLSVAIEADQYAFQLYSGGVFTNTSCGTNLDHATNVVGNGTSGGIPYWYMRNSWGTGWGASGYMYVEQVAGHGICGIQMEPNYALA